MSSQVDPLPVNTTLALAPMVSLHRKVAKVLSEALDDAVERYNPKILDCAIKFLANNDIDLTINPKDNPEKAKTETLDTLRILADNFEKEDMIEDVA